MSGFRDYRPARIRRRRPTTWREKVLSALVHKIGTVLRADEVKLLVAEFDALVDEVNELRRAAGLPVGIDSGTLVADADDLREDS